MKINLWDNIKSRNSVNIDIVTWLDMIKSSNYEKEIQAARLVGKSNPLYNQIKNNLPAATLNFSFKSQRKNEDVISSTGYCYLDFDCSSKDEAEQLKLKLSTDPYIFACWLSLSELGVGALVKVECLSIESFKEQYLDIISQLGLEVEIDKMAIKATQPNALSLDPNIYININSLTKKCKLPIIDSKEVLYKEVYSFPETEAEEFVRTFTGLIWETYLPMEEYENRDVVFKDAMYFKAYWPFVNRGQPKRISTGERNNTFSALINNLRILNPNEENQVLSISKYFNSNFCITPLSSSELQKMVSYAYSREPQPIGVRIKKTWINPNCENKLKALGDARKLITIDKIETYLSEALCSNKKITITSIAKATGISRQTIHKYVTLYENEINEFNNNLKIKK
jgi:hypothetical protein